MNRELISLSEWMSNLPPNLQRKPLINLCIPGSHDSFTCALDRRGPIGNDQPSWLQILAKFFPPLKFVVYNWSQCQKLSLKAQLETGVRYLDIRLTRERNEIRTIHGLCGQNFDSLVSEIESFLNDHSKEIVILDFNHFYNMKIADHQKVIYRLLTVFGSRCCPMPPFADLTSLSLRTCWTYGWRVIIFYQICFNDLECIVDSIPIAEFGTTIHCPVPFLFWTSQFIKGPWANTDKIRSLIDFLECTLRHKRKILPCGGFFVSQGVLTPQVKDVVLRPFSTLRNRMGVPAVKAVIDWLNERGSVIKSDLNIVMADFVETDDFCRKVIALNLTM